MKILKEYIIARTNKITVKFTKKESEDFFEQFDTNEQIKQYIMELIKAEQKIENI